MIFGLAVLDSAEPNFLGAMSLEVQVSLTSPDKRQQRAAMNILV